MKAGEHRVYNLEVEQEHQFYVGESGVLVHNAYVQKKFAFMEEEEAAATKPYADPNNRPAYAEGQVEEVWRNAQDGPNGVRLTFCTLPSKVQNVSLTLRPFWTESFVNTYAYDNCGRMAWASQTGQGTNSNVVGKALTFNYSYGSLNNGTPTFETVTRRYEGAVPNNDPTQLSASWISNSSDRVDLGTGGNFVTMQYQGNLPANADDFPVDSSTIAKYVTLTDPRGLALTSSTTRPNPTTNSPSQSTSNTYDNFGQLTQSVTTSTTGPGQTQTQTQTYQYDDNGNRLSDQIGANNHLTYSSSALSYYTYDANGNVKTELTFNSVDSGNVTSDACASFANTSSLSAGEYQLALKNVIVNTATVTVQLCKGQSLVPVVIFSMDVTGVSIGGGQYAFNTTVPFNLPTSYSGGSFYVLLKRPDQSTPNCSGGSVELDAASKYMVFTWDSRNRLVEAQKYVTIYNGNAATTVTVPGTTDTVPFYLNQSQEYTYDVFNQLIGTKTYSEAVNTRTLTDTQEFVNVQGEAMVTFHERVGIYQDVVIGLYGQGVDSPAAVNWTRTQNSTSSNTIVWPLTDQQGTVRDVVGHTIGQSVSIQSVTYTPFGVPTGGGLSIPLSTFYAGRNLDSFTGLYNNRTRWYDPAAGRFISQDFIGFAGGTTNLYAYCGNSPANGTDPSGCIVFNIGAAGIGAGIGAILGGGGYALNSWLTGTAFNSSDFWIATGAGAASGALAGFTFGGSLLVQGAISGTLMGATYGALNAGGTTWNHGGSVADIGCAAFKGAAIGAAAGAVGGVVAGGVLGRVGQNFVGYVSSGIAGGVAGGGVGGGIGGYMQTGTVGGALYGAYVGMLEGGILGGAGGAMAYGAPYVARSAVAAARWAANGLVTSGIVDMSGVNLGVLGRYRWPGVRFAVDPNATGEEVVGAVEIGHQLKANKITDFAELNRQVDGQVAGWNRIIESEGMPALKARIRAYGAEVEAGGRAYVDSLPPAGKSPSGEALAHLHVPDMRTGGGPYDVGGTGVLRINSIIGGNATRVAGEILAMPDNTTRIVASVVLR